MIACANKTHTVKGDGVAEACAVRTHAACTSTLVALRPPLRVCEPFFKISFLALGSRSTSGSCRGQTTVRRDATELVDHKSCAHRLGSLGYQPGPSKPELDVRLSSTNRHSAFSVVVLLYTTDGDAFLALKKGGCHARQFFLVRLAPPYPASTRVGGGAINNTPSHKHITHTQIKKAENAQRAQTSLTKKHKKKTENALTFLANLKKT